MISEVDPVEVLAYKFIGQHYIWLVDEYDLEEDEKEECQPLYAPIEDEL